jgi:hypothetical protein
LRSKLFARAFDEGGVEKQRLRPLVVGEAIERAEATASVMTGKWRFSSKALLPQAESRTRGPKSLAQLRDQ